MTILPPLDQTILSKKWPGILRFPERAQCVVMGEAGIVPVAVYGFAYA
jgi:hypothetical protein